MKIIFENNEDKEYFNELTYLAELGMILRKMGLGLTDESEYKIYNSLYSKVHFHTNIDKPDELQIDYTHITY